MAVKNEETERRRRRTSTSDDWWNSSARYRGAVYGVDISILSGVFRQCSSVRSGVMRSYLVTLAENAPESVSHPGIPNVAITRRLPRILGPLVAVHFSTVDLNRKKHFQTKYYGG